MQKLEGHSILPLLENTVFENPIKSRIQHCNRSELRLNFEWSKVIKMPNMVHCGDFLKNEALVKQCNKSILIRQKLKENAKIKKSKCDILTNFQTTCNIKS